MPVDLELITHIGCDSCAGEHAVTPTFLAFLDDGRLASLDRFEPFVRVFRPDGELDVAFGTKGQGPGDLGFPGGGSDYIAGMFLIPEPGGGVSVMNPLPPGLDTFDASGEFLTETTLDLATALPHAQAFSAPARVYYRFSTVPFSDAPNMIERCTLVPGAPFECGPFVEPASFIQPEYPATSPLQRLRPSLATMPNGNLVVVDPSTYRIWILDGDGAVVASTRRDIPRVEKGEEELEAERASNARLPANRRRPVDPLRGHLDRAGVHVDGTGRIWLLTERHDRTNSVFDVFDHTGRFLTEVSIEATVRTGPWHIEPFTISGDLLAAISWAPDGNLGIEVYRIVGG